MVKNDSKVFKEFLFDQKLKIRILNSDESNDKPSGIHCIVGNLLNNFGMLVLLVSRLIIFNIKKNKRIEQMIIIVHQTEYPYQDEY